MSIIYSTQNPAIIAEVKRLHERIYELECMVKVFRGCIDTQLIPMRGSPCNVKIRQLVGDSNV